jgi:hypothetical protein
MITKLKTENPDVVCYGGTSPGVGLFYEQLRRSRRRAPSSPPTPPSCPTSSRRPPVTAEAPGFVPGPALRRQPEASVRRGLQESVQRERPLFFYPGTISAVIIEAMKGRQRVSRESIVKA